MSCTGHMAVKLQAPAARPGTAEPSSATNLVLLVEQALLFRAELALTVSPAQPAVSAGSARGAIFYSAYQYFFNPLASSFFGSEAWQSADRAAGLVRTIKQSISSPSSCARAHGPSLRSELHAFTIFR